MSGLTANSLRPLSIGLSLLTLGSGLALGSLVLLAGLTQYAPRGVSYVLTALFLFSATTVMAAPLACFFGPIGARARGWLSLSFLIPIAGLWLGGYAGPAFTLCGIGCALKFLAVVAEILELPQATLRLRKVVGTALIAAAMLAVSAWLTPYPWLWRPLFLLALAPLATSLVGTVVLLAMLAARSRQLQRDLEPREEHVGLSPS